MLENFTGYEKKNWKNSPDKTTPLSAENLDHMDSGIKMNADAVIELREQAKEQEKKTDDALNAVNTKLGKTDFTITAINSSYVFVGSSYKENGRAYINGYFGCPSPTAGITTCMFIPTGFRPKQKVGSAAYTDDDTNFNQIGGIKINTNGDVTLYFPTVYSRYMYVNIVYDVA